MNPVTGQFLGPGSTIAIGAIVPNTGDSTNGISWPGKASPRPRSSGRSSACAALRHGA